MLYPYLSVSGFLVNFAAPDKQWANLKPVFKAIDDVSSVQKIYKFTKFTKILHCVLHLVIDNNQ